MSTVKTFVLISKEQRAHILDIDARHPGRTSSRAIRLGSEFIHTPLRDYAMITFCLDGTLAYSSEDARERAWRLMWNPAGEEVEVPLETDFHEAAVKHFTALEWTPLIGFSVCLWYGLLAYRCKARSLREAVFQNYPKRKDDPLSTLLNDGKTFAGQAYMASTGPKHARCSDCYFYQHRQAKNGKELDGSCDKYTELMGIGSLPRFPSSALACRYYEETGNASKMV